MSYTFESSSNADAKDAFVFQNEIYTNVSQPIPLSPPCPPSSHGRRRRFWRDTWNDLKSTKWRRLFKRFCSHFLPLPFMTCLIWLIVRLLHPWAVTKSACMSDGTFNLDINGQTGYNPWERGSVFAIDLGFGNTDFATAKGIDVLWDIGFGRGMQGLLTVISYKVCTKALSRLMESRAVTFRTFEAVALQGDSFAALYKLVRDLFSNGGARTMLIVAWITTSMIFLLSFQSIASAMTGYSAKLGGFVQTDSGERVPANLFEAVQYVIHDGHRLGESFYDDYPITMPIYGDISASSYFVHNYTSYVTAATSYYMLNQCQYFAPLGYDALSKGTPFRWQPDSPGQEGYIKCTLMWHVSEYTAQYGFLGLNATSSVFNNSGPMIQLPSPALNISAYFGEDYGSDKAIAWGTIPFGYFWENPDGQHPFQKPNPRWAYLKNILTLTELNSRGTCQQQDLTDIKYQWGFSSMLLLIFTFLLFIWTLGTYAMYLDAYFNSKLDIEPRDLGLKRALFDIHAEMSKEVNLDQVDHLGSSKLNQLIKSGRIDYTRLVSDTSTTRNAQVKRWWQEFDIREWLKRESWWLAALLLFTILSILSYTTRVRWWWRPTVSPLPWLGTVLVIVAGRAHRSRWILFLIPFIVFWAFNGTLIAMTLGW